MQMQMNVFMFPLQCLTIYIIRFTFFRFTSLFNFVFDEVYQTIIEWIILNDWRHLFNYFYTYKQLLQFDYSILMFLYIYFTSFSYFIFIRCWKEFITRSLPKSFCRNILRLLLLLLNYCHMFSHIIKKWINQTKKS